MTLEVRHLNKEYPTRSGALPVLRDVSFELKAGDALGVMGPSGSGKSTLLHVLGTLDRPTSGTVTVAGKDPFLLTEKALADFRNHNVGFIFQDHHLLPQCSVLENVLIPTLVSPPIAPQSRPPAGEPAAGRQSHREDVKPQTIEAWARELLERVGLSNRLEHRPAELSGGERQRVAVARALIHRPALLLADEPTGNLDRRAAAAVAGLLMELHQQERTVLVVVTHSAELAERVGRRAEMVDGQLQFAGGQS